MPVSVAYGGSEPPSTATWETGYNLGQIEVSAMEHSETCELLLELGSDEPTETAQLNHLARKLNKEFQQANIDSGLPTVPAPAETRSGLEVMAGAILVKVAPDLIPLVLKQLMKFIFRSPDRSIKVKVQLGDRSVEVEYPTAASLSDDDVAALVKRLRGTIAPG
jgi:hypothetical protein